jgi:hypothetical protein
VRGSYALSIRDFARVALSPYCQDGLFGMLTASFDDSGTHASSEITLLAGLFGNRHQWTLFNDLWREVLRDTVPNKSVDSFHAAECYSAHKDFSGWSRTESNFLMHELGRVIIRCGLAGCATSVARKAWDKNVVGDLKRAAGDAEGGCIRTVFLDTLYWAQQFANYDDEIAFAFEARPEREREYKTIYSIFAANNQLTKEKPELVSLSFLRSAKMPPLQGADLFAWEMYQEEVLSLTEPLPPKKFHRKLIGDLVKTGRFKIRNGDAATIVAHRAAVEEMIDPAVLDHAERHFGKF